MNLEEREKGDEPAGKAEQAVGREGEALSVEGDDGQSQVEDGVIAQSIGPQRNKTVWAGCYENSIKHLKWRESRVKGAAIT